MDTRELKPCPFCGGKAQLHGNGKFSWVNCLECGVETPGDATSDTEAIASWNARASDSALSSQAAEIERLREALEWYCEQARMSSGGDAGHAALEKDGGKRARAALTPKPNKEGE